MGGRLLSSAAFAVAAFAAAAGLTACGTGVPPGAKTSASTYTVTAHVASVVINGGGGQITVTGSDRSTVQVTERLHFSKKAPATTHVVSGSTLTLSFTCATQLDCGVVYDVQVPRGVSVRATNRQGTIVLTSLSGPVTARTVAGAISATGLGGPSADLKSNAGSISAVFTVDPSAVRASTNAGSISLTVPGSVAYQVTAHTFVGSTAVTVRQATGSAHKITADVSIGSITIAPSS